MPFRKFLEKYSTAFSIIELTPFLKIFFALSGTRPEPGINLITRWKSNNFLKFFLNSSDGDNSNLGQSVIFLYLNGVNGIKNLKFKTST